MTHYKKKASRRTRTSLNTDRINITMRSNELNFVSPEIIEQEMFSLLNQIIKRNYYTNQEQTYMKLKLKNLSRDYYFQNYTYKPQ